MTCGTSDRVLVGTSRRVVIPGLVFAFASALGCGLDFDRYNPHAGSADGGSGSRGDAALDVMEAADGELPADVGAEGEGASPDGGGGPEAGDAGASDSGACGTIGQPCCSGGTCQNGLHCRGNTCHP